MADRYLTVEDRIAAGKAARDKASLKSHRRFTPVGDRDPLGLLERQAKDRIPELVPIRYGRMLASPFAYFRGAALPMADDLAAGPNSGLTAQLCGDAHLANFGVYASPERRLVFDVNDFDETSVGPFEWDVKRLAASLVIAGRDNGFDRESTDGIVRAGLQSYREAMRSFADQPLLTVWYSRLDVDDAFRSIRHQLKKRQRVGAVTLMAKIRARDSLQVLDKLTEVVDGRRRIISNPPLVVPIEQLAGEIDVSAMYDALEGLVHDYGKTLSTDRQHLVARYRLTGVARKVVGVGSVGTQSWILLLEGDHGDPLFLQAKQASRSVLADYAPAPEFANQGERVVVGQRLMQSASDIFLGWQRISGPDGRGEGDYYVRQLRDGKYSLPIDQLNAQAMLRYGQICGWTLARAHAGTGDRIAIAAYLGKTDRFDLAVATFAQTYADQNERDHAALDAAVQAGRIAAVPG